MRCRRRGGPRPLQHLARDLYTRDPPHPHICEQQLQANASTEPYVEDPVMRLDVQSPDRKTVLTGVGQVEDPADDRSEDTVRMTKLRHQTVT